MKSLAGFTLFSNLSKDRVQVLHDQQMRSLGYFEHFEKRSIVVGETCLELWGRHNIDECIRSLADGSLLVLVGSPSGATQWKDLDKGRLFDNFELPWDGRVILIHISSDGKNWTMWNDWLGSIPVFHAKIERGRIASTLEPVTVAAAGYTPDDFFLPGLVSLLINGHYLSDWTLYKEMKNILPDSVTEWDEEGFRTKQLCTVQPSEGRWEAGWNDLVDEMYELSRKAVTDALNNYPKWILPLSSGLDSRLIAGVAAKISANVHAYVWGAPHTTDVVNSQKIAKVLGFPWKSVDLPKDFLGTYTRPWADWFGSGMHFHGMYQMSFLDEILSEPSAPVISGFIGDVLAGDAIKENYTLHFSKRSYQLESDWYSHWTVNEVNLYAKFPLKEALEANADELKRQIEVLPGAFYQKMQFLELWNRQRCFTSFQSTLSDYWRGVANPFMNREYARFCLSLPRVALDDRRLLSDVFRRYYGRLAVIPGTYAKDPFILTGSYLLKRRLTEKLPSAFHRGPLLGFGNVQLRMDVHSIQATGRDALWPIFDVCESLSEWIDLGQLERDYETIMMSAEDISPLRRLQSIQTLAYRLLHHKDNRKLQ